MKMPARREFFAKLGAIGGLFALAAPAQAQTSAQRRFIKTDFSQSHAYSQAVVTQGGRTVWLAGQTSPPTDAREICLDEAALRGKSLAGDFDGQVRALFAGLSQTLEEAGGKLSDIVTMTVFMVDDRFDLRFLELRKEIFKDNFPASALINIHSLVPPYAMIEIQCVAVIA
ncbi:MAG: Rid family hydrolase [Xanthobacteraceae bacterium]